MHAAERPQEGAQPRARSFTGGAVGFPHTVAIIIARPRVLSVMNPGMREIQPMVPALLVRIDDRGITRNGFAQHALAGRCVTVADQWAPLFTTLAADDMNDRWPVVSVAVSLSDLFGGYTSAAVRPTPQAWQFPGSPAEWPDPQG